jgi:glycosyltransferase involved in cell wall biosynthesis
MPGGSTQLRVLMLPDYSDSNPYQRLLTSALAVQGVEVRLARPPGRDPLPIIRAWLRAGRPRVVHLHWTHNYLARGGRRRPLGGPLLVGQLRTLRRLGVRIVWTVHNLGAHEGELGDNDRSVHRRVAEASDAILVHCDAARGAVEEAYSLGPGARARLRIIPHGSYLGAYPDTLTRAEARASLDVHPGARAFLFLGAIRDYKGLEDLVIAFRSLDAPGARLLIAGRAADGPIADRLRGAAASDPRVGLWLGHVPDDRVQRYLRAADAVVLPFRDVLTSGSAILAMSFGRAVVAPGLGCLPETVGADAGITYDPGDPEGLVAALRTALAADLEGMGRRALARARELDWASIAAATAAAYRG